MGAGALKNLLRLLKRKKGAGTADKLRKPSIHAGCGCPQLSKKSADKVRTKCGQTGEIPDSEI
jgi:hypothetical protein